jgi:hypothetical protein
MRRTSTVLDQHSTDGADPFFIDQDVVGLYRPDHAAAAALATLTDGGSGQWRTDD